MASGELTIRAATPADRDAVVALCRASLGWGADDPNEAFFAWKHDENPFGPSPGWVAESGGDLVGVRMFLRWRFRDPDGEPLHAVRAVDTATHPNEQGAGVFTRLTLGALPDLRDLGVDFVFNTPNDKSRPGYLKMGWGEVGRVPVGVRVNGVGRLQRLLGARAAAEKWSSPSDVGLAPIDAFADDDEVESLLRGARSGAISTDRDVAYLRWRYSFEPLHYRVVPVGDRLGEGAVICRFRRRGSALEATIADLAVADPRAVRAAVGRILRAGGADYAIAGGGRRLLGAGFLPAPLGPTLTWKPICRPSVPSMRDLDLGMGDVELF